MSVCQLLVAVGETVSKCAQKILDGAIKAAVSFKVVKDTKPN